MALLANILTALDKWPLWKAMQVAPERLDKLETRVATLEAELEARPAVETCPICGIGTLKTISIKEHPTMGTVGLQEKHLACDHESCSHTEQRMHDPLGLADK